MRPNLIFAFSVKCQMILLIKGRALALNELSAICLWKRGLILNGLKHHSVQLQARKKRTNEKLTQSQTFDVRKLRLTEKKKKRRVRFNWNRWFLQIWDSKFAWRMCWWMWLGISVVISSWLSSDLSMVTSAISLLVRNFPKTSSLIFFLPGVWKVSSVCFI